MKIGILLADELRDSLKDVFSGNYADMFTDLLDGHGFTFEVYDVREQQYPPAVDACDGYLITGSRHGVYDPLPWLEPLFEFIRRVHAARVPLLGVCFGHQAVAHALGGRAEKSAKGWGMGAHTWKLEKTMPWMKNDSPFTPPLRGGAERSEAGGVGGSATELRLLCIHQDQVAKLPPGATRLAGSDFCGNAAFSIGTHIFCVQGHPEFTAEYVYALLDVLKERAPPEIIAAARKTTAEAVDSKLCAQWMAEFFKQGAAST